MNKTITISVSLFFLGLIAGSTMTLSLAAENSKPAFLIVAADRNAGITDADYTPYRQAAGPLAAAAGLTMTATTQQPVLLEGNWPYGNVAIEQFSSMQALRNFWFSEDYQQAKQLREGLSTINFIVAVEGN